MLKLLAILCAAALSVNPAQGQITGRLLPTPLYGVTFDDVSNPAAELKALGSLVRVPTVRIVFDRGVSPGKYKTPITEFRRAAYTMGELIDSSYMRQYRSVAAVQSWTANYINALGGFVDIWEIGNEINGDWLGGNVFAKMAAMYDIVSNAGGTTALTFFYEGEVTDRNNCIDSQGGMFPWIARYFQKSPTLESEKIRLGLNYALISWYPDQCRGEKPDWPAVFTKLAAIFPNAKVGFGELGTANPQGGSVYEKNEITTYYPMSAGTGGLPASYVGGVFWWYAAEELVPWPGSLGTTLNQAFGR